MNEVANSETMALLKRGYIASLELREYGLPVEDERTIAESLIVEAGPMADLPEIINLLEELVVAFKIMYCPLGMLDEVCQ